jgi:hypothetical protein
VGCIVSVLTPILIVNWHSRLPSTANIGNTTSVIVEAGYLVRSVYIEGTALHINGDLNATVPIKVIGAPSTTKDLHFNNLKIPFTTDPMTGEWSSTLPYTAPVINLPDLSTLDWKFLDNLPEIKPTYDDSKWTVAGHTTSANPYALKTPTSLFSCDYGYNTGVLIYRGHFTASGNESSIYLSTEGGSAYGSSVWLNSTYLGSWPGIDSASNHNDTYSLPNLRVGKNYVLTVVIDNNGLDENWVVGVDQMKLPRGILDYELRGRPQSAITWKLTGNLGGESYIDRTRGPLNEGGLYAERQGYTAPFPPNHNWISGSPLTGFKNAGVAFYQADFHLGLPKNYDIPLSFVFGNTTIGGITADYRAQLWVNG